MIIDYEMRVRRKREGCRKKVNKRGQMIKYSRWKGCEKIRKKNLKQRLKWNDLKSNEMRCEIKRIERSEAGEDIRR